MDDRTRKAEKISSILTDYCGNKLATFSCLDLGCATGIISAYLASKCSTVIGIDIDQARLKVAQQEKQQSMMSPFYAHGSGSQLPFLAGTFDVVICAQVYEHVRDPQRMVEEIFRVLKPGGLCFFSGPNRLAIVEEHYWLPFLSWLPGRIASAYMRLAKRGNIYDIYPLTYWQLKRLWKKFRITDYSLNLFREPTKYSVDERVNRLGIVRFLPDWLIKSLRAFYPNYNWIVVKPDE